MAIDVEPYLLTRLVLALAALVLVAVAAGVSTIAYQRRRPAPAPPPPLALSLAAPPGVELGAGDEPLDAAIAPDSARVAFVATRNGTTRLWQRSLDAGSAQPIPGTDGAESPAWKATGRVVAFFAGGRLRQVAIDTGAVRDLADAADPLGATWMPDGSLLFAAGRGPVHRLKDGVLSNATTLHEGDRSHAFPSATGDGDGFVYLATRQNGDRVIRLVEQGQEHDLTETTSNAMLVDGRLLYVRDNVLFSRVLDPKTLALTGEATSIATNVGVDADGHALFAASPRLILTSPLTTRARALVWLDANGTRSAPAGEPGDYWQVRLSPDDAAAAITVLAPLLRTLDVWIQPLGREGQVQQLTYAVAADSDPVWSGDGSRVLFRSLQGGTPDLYTHAIRDEGTSDQRFLKSELDETPTDWNDSDVLFQAPRPRSGLDIFHLDTDDMSIEGVATSTFNETDARWSPDGRWISYVSDESGRPDVYAQRWPPDGRRVRVSMAGGSRPRWGRDGALYFVRGEQMMRADPQNDAAMPFTTPRALFPVPGLRDFDVAHASDRFLVLVPVDAVGQTSVTAIVDWQGR
jgi:Tol biopolymer transport system component